MKDVVDELRVKSVGPCGPNYQLEMAQLVDSICLVGSR